MKKNKNQLEKKLKSKGIKYNYKDCQDTEIRILSKDKSRIFDIKELNSTLKGIKLFDPDENKILGNIILNDFYI